MSASLHLWWLVCLLPLLPSSLGCVFGNGLTALNFTNMNLPLYKWTHVDNSNVTTFLSLCRPLKFKKSFKSLLPCNGSLLCTINGTSVTHTVSRHLPYFVHNHRGDSVTMIFFGSHCPTGIQFRTDITFFCKKSWGVPRVIPTDNECALKIMWPSPAGCPMYQSKSLQVNSEKCTVGNPSKNFLYEFKSNQDYYLVSGSNGNVKFVIKACGRIHTNNELPRGCWGKTVCMIPQHGRSVVGFEDSLSSIVSQEDHFEKVYKSSSFGCEEYITKIRFFCKNYAVTERGPFLSSYGKCSTTIDWHSMAACPLHIRPTCIVKGEQNAHIYDLTPIVAPSGIYYLPLDNGNYTKVHMDICSIVARSNEFGTENGAVLKYKRITVESQATTEFYNFNTELEKRLLLEYFDHRTCQTNSSQKITFNIELTCSNSTYHSRPIYQRTEGCVHYSIWPHVAGCSLEKIRPADCTVQNPLTGYVYDLKKLVGRSFTLNLPDTNDEIELQVCKPPRRTYPSMTCGQNVGACLKKKNDSTPISLGLSNSDLEMNLESLMLRYTWGDKCPDLLDDRHTIIIFSCGPVDLGPQFREAVDNCSYHFTWETPLACQSEVQQQQEPELVISRHMFHFICSFLIFLFVAASLLGILASIPSTRNAFLSVYKKCLTKTNSEREHDLNSESSKPLHTPSERP